MFCKFLLKIPSFSSKYGLNLADKTSIICRRWCSVRVGQTAELTKVFTSRDVQKFADISLDTNPVHTDPEFAKVHSRFGACIVHGVLINGLVSAIFGTKIGGHGSLYLSQTVEFTTALFVGEPVTARAEVTKIEKRIVECTFNCVATNRDKVVLRGTARLMVPREALV
ncbi:hydroxyacyl-thioester dehydratase type 2, mitochondrial-like isoform X2 [Lineus longissimus]|uniref:hydroxyacyl-thioester dehydratase type 2, mitochondrial-like isoform X2 n=1 Tax=Lineus longissimus TaxID=88925 RepID=UPI00315C747C